MADTEQTPVPTLDYEKLRSLGVRMLGLFDQYKKDRRSAEHQMLANLRQFRGMYDPEIEQRIPADQSKAYPKVTRTKVIGTVARLMEMLFPQTEKNWAIKPSELPELSEADLQKVLDQLTAEAGDQPITDEMIEKGIHEFASHKAGRMSKEMDDQLQEIEYITLARGVVFSGVLYSAGILKGPQVITHEGRTWTRDGATGKLVAKTVKKLRPMYEKVPVWDWYPDLSAKAFKQMDGSFQRHIMSRNQVAELAKRPDFFKDVIETYLRDNTSGNYVELHWETELRRRSADRTNVSDLTGRKYELWEWWGFVSGHELKACGAAVPDDELHQMVEASIWGIGNTVIKGRLNPYDERIRPYHVFVYEEDDINLLGTGLPAIMRDSQMAICEASRMLLDNASVVCGDMVEINYDLLVPGQNLDIYARKKWLREGTGPETQYPAVRAVPLSSHIPELQAVIELFMGFADTETALPPPTLGDPSQGGSEALRTSSNMSMLMGAAALPIRDTVRNFDQFTTSFISSLYYWNDQFNPNPDIKGDYTIIARGSTSLIAKEVRASKLDAFASTLSEDERMYISTEKLLSERMKSHDIPQEILEKEDKVAERLAEQARRAELAAQNQQLLVQAQIKQGIAAAFKDIADAMKANTSANVETFTALVEGIANVASSESDAKQAGRAPAKA